MQSQTERYPSTQITAILANHSLTPLDHFLFNRMAVLPTLYCAAEGKKLVLKVF